MSEVSFASASLVSAANRSASSSSLNEKDQQSGKVLPPKITSIAPKPIDVNKVDVVGNHRESVKAAVAQMNEYVQATQRDLHFSYDSGTGDTIVRVLDRKTQEVIRQIPDEIFLKLARNLSVDEPVHLFNAQA